MYKILILMSVLAWGVVANAQEAKDELIGNTKAVELTASKDTTQGWKTGGVFTLNFSNVGLQNWAAGGANSYSFTALTGLYAHFHKGNSTWDNNLDLGLGSIRQFAPGTKSSDAPWVKSDDKIDFTSKYGQKATEKWYYSGLLNFKSQFLAGFDDAAAPDSVRNVISKFLAPAYGIIAIGMDYKPNKEFSAFIAPLTAKTTFVMDADLSNAGAFGVDPGEQFRLEVGAYLRMLYTKDIAKNVNFSTKVEVFDNYQRYQHIDLNWETLTSMKVNEYLTATFTTHLIYDDDIDIVLSKDGDGNPTKVGPAVQFKHVLGVGFTYKF